MDFLKSLLGDAYKDGMTLEEVNDALKKAKVAAPSAVNSEVDKYKKLLSDKNSEISKLNKDLKARMTAEEQAEEERAKQWNDLIEENKALKKEKQIGEYTNKYLSLGYDSDLAKKTAEALFDGDMETVFANQSAFNSALTSSVKEKLVQSDPIPRSGTANNGMTKQEFSKLSTNDKNRFMLEHEAEYKAMLESN